jgi:hypothetical protein
VAEVAVEEEERVEVCSVVLEASGGGRVEEDFAELDAPFLQDPWAD